MTLLLLPAFTGAAQAAPGASSNAAEPDLTGVWERFPDPYGNSDFPPDPPPPGGDPDLKAPYLAQWHALRKKQDEAQASGKPLIDASTQCIPEGMPTLMLAVYPIEILQTPKRITVLGEYLTQTRRVYLDEPQKDKKDIILGYYGSAVGKWTNGVLEIETEGVQKSTMFYDFPHSENMKIYERIRLTAPDKFEDQVTIEDPEYLNKPYKYTITYSKKPGYKVGEFVCDYNKYKVGADGKEVLDLGR